MTAAYSSTQPPSQTAPGVRALLLFAAPVTGGLLAQNVMSLISTGMIGRLGEPALAGVGLANALFWALGPLLYGPIAAVQTLVARALGAGQPAAGGRALTAGLAVEIVVALAVAAAAIFGLPALLPQLLHDPAAVGAGQSYLASYGFIALPLAANMSFAAYWNGAGAPRRALYINLLQLPVHVALSYALVFGRFGAPALGTFGAGLGAAVSCAFATLLHLALALRLDPIPGLFRRWGAGVLADISRIGLPISLQQHALALGLAIFFSLIAQLGVRATAGFNAITSLMAIPGLVASGVAAAAATWVARLLGASAANAASTAGWRAARLAAVVEALLALGLIVAPQAALSLFLHGPAVADAVLPLQILALSLAADAFSQTLMSALTGAGATRLPALINFILQWAVQLPLCWWVAERTSFGLAGVGVVFAVRSAIEAAVMAWLWRAGGWRRAMGRSAVDEARTALASAQRIAVLGGAGAGKSTVTRALAAQLGLPATHLDRLRFGPGWTEVASELFEARLAELAAEPAWIADGTYWEARQTLMPRADLVIWLDQPTLLRLWRAWNKTRHPERPRADRPDGCEEAFGWSYVRTILSFGRWTPRIEAGLRTSAPSAVVVRVKGDREVARLLAVEDRVGRLQTSEALLGAVEA